jgi:hypothetical protein
LVVSSQSVVGIQQRFAFALLCRQHGRQMSVVVPERRKAQQPAVAGPHVEVTSGSGPQASKGWQFVVAYWGAGGGASPTSTVQNWYEDSHARPPADELTRTPVGPLRQ